METFVATVGIIFFFICLGLFIVGRSAIDSGERHIQRAAEEKRKQEQEEYERKQEEY